MSSGLGTAPSSLPHPLAIAIPPAQSSSSLPTSGSNSPLSEQLHRRHQLSLSRVRTYGGGSTLQIPGPISPIDSGHYVALVQNSVGYERCTTSLFVRSPLAIRLEWASSPLTSGSASPLPSSSSFSVATDSNSQSGSSSNRSNRQSPVIRALRGETITLRCLVNGFPVSELYWLHNAQSIAAASTTSLTSDAGALGGTSGTSSLPSSSSSQSDGQQQQSSRGGNTVSSSLLLQLNEQSKGGMYQCFARNRFQIVQTSAEIVVIGTYFSTSEHTLHAFTPNDNYFQLFHSIINR